VSGFKKILDGEVDQVPEWYFMYKASIDDVVKSFEKDQK
jgi:F0F1-type ATP synthase beta subunit